MLHRIQISTNTCEVTMQVKRANEKATLHKLPINNEYMRLCWVSTLFWMICCLFSNCSKSSTIRLYNVFPCVVNVPRSHVPVLLAMQWSVAWRSAFYRGREHLWIVFSFNSERDNRQEKTRKFRKFQKKRTFSFFLDNMSTCWCITWHLMINKTKFIQLINNKIWIRPSFPTHSGTSLQ